MRLKLNFFNIVIMVTSFWFTTAFATSSQLTDIQINPISPTHTQIFLDFSQANNFKEFSLDNPDRIILDLKNTNKPAKLASPQAKNEIIKGIRFGIQQQINLRMVVDLQQKVKAKVSVIPLYKAGAQRVVLDLYSQTPGVPLATPVKETAVPSAKREIVVLIDPGHGGKDPGAKGAGGENEKAVVLEISKKLAELVNQQKGMKAVLTRQGDYYLTLRQRLEIARARHADIFIAIHADAYQHQGSHGASVYALSLRGASSEAARWLAEKENYSELGGVDLSDKGDMLRSVLLDLSQTATISSSLTLGSDILQNLGSLARLHHREVEQAAFVVLKSPDIPSVLVETGFISNPQDEMNLKNSQYQEKLARAILTGMNVYFVQHPLAGSDLATSKT